MGWSEERRFEFQPFSVRRIGKLDDMDFASRRENFAVWQEMFAFMMLPHFN
jgi:hypothetical protein